MGLVIVAGHAIRELAQMKEYRAIELKHPKDEDEFEGLAWYYRMVVAYSFWFVGFIVGLPVWIILMIMGRCDGSAKAWADGQ